jgi:hypothetical protein
MWHLHWHADAPRSRRVESRPVERVRTAADDVETTTGRGSFQVVWHDTPAGSMAGDVPETVRVRGR